MAYFIDVANLRVVVRPPGAVAGQGQAIIDGETAIACDLTHGQTITADQAQALLDGSPSRFRALAGVADESATPQHLADTPPAPPLHTPSTEPVTVASVRSPAAERANRVATIVEVVSWIVLILSLILGVAVAAQTRTTIDGESVHPFVWTGIGIAIGGAFQCLVVIMIAAYIEAKTE